MSIPFTKKNKFGSIGFTVMNHLDAEHIHVYVKDRAVLQTDLLSIHVEQDSGFFQLTPFHSSYSLTYSVYLSPIK